MISSLRARLLLMVVVISCLTAGVTGAAVSIVVRDWVYQDAQEAVLTTFRLQMQAYEQRGQSDFLADLAPEYTVAFDGRITHEGTVGASDVPEAMSSDLRRIPSLYRFQRTGDGGILVGHSLNHNGLAGPVVIYWKQPLDDVGPRLRRLMWLVLVAVIGSAVLGAGVGLIIVRSVTGPFRRIAKVTAAVAAGDGDARLPAAGMAELRDLSTSFNTMLDRQAHMIEALRDQDARSRRFVGDVSHELRSPLAALVPASEVLREEAAVLTPGSDLQKASELVAAEADSLSKLVEDLLEFSRMDAGVAEVRTEQIELMATIRDAIGTRGWETVTVDGPQSLVLQTDRGRIVAVVTNLVANAVRHGAPPVTVVVRDGARAVTVEVHDHGPGVLDRDAGPIFDRFVKTSTARSRGGGTGAGLGLAIARENARLLGGDVWYRRGGTVTIFAASFAR